MTHSGVLENKCLLEQQFVSTTVFEYLLRKFIVLIEYDIQY